MVPYHTIPYTIQFASRSKSVHWWVTWRILIHGQDVRHLRHQSCAAHTSYPWINECVPIKTYTPGSTGLDWFSFTDKMCQIGAARGSLSGTSYPWTKTNQDPPGSLSWIPNRRTQHQNILPIEPSCFVLLSPGCHIQIVYHYTCHNEVVSICIDHSFSCFFSFFSWRNCAEFYVTRGHVRDCRSIWRFHIGPVWYVAYLEI